jgi:hypothetical protein
MRTLPRRPMLLVPALVIIAGAFATLGTGRAALPVVVAGQADFAGLVDIGGGRRLYLECRGAAPR